MPDALVGRVVEAIERAARTGRIGDGKIFVTTVDEAVRIRARAARIRGEAVLRKMGIAGTRRA